MSATKQAIIVTDLGYGDAGKGSIVDYLTRLTNAHTVVRYSGGAQAAHNVVTSDGAHHTFAQFGSGTLVPGTQTFLSRYMMVNPLNMFKEEEHLQELGVRDAFERTYIDQAALITTPFQQAANRLKEMARDTQRHGSCGLGIGETMSDYLELGSQTLFASDLLDTTTLRKKLLFLQSFKREQLQSVISPLPTNKFVTRELRVLQDSEIVDIIMDYYAEFVTRITITDEDYLRRPMERSGTVIFEGSQGILLDEWYGFHPYTTWSTTTPQNAVMLIAETDYTGDTIKLGLVRAYATRHGAGPFVTEDEVLTSALPDYHNETNAWQREFRVGYFDVPITRYAIEATGKLDFVVVSSLDRMKEQGDWKVCTGYSYVGADVVEPFFEMETNRVVQVRVNRSCDLVYQEQLMQRLRKCTPVYERLSERTDESYLSYLEQSLLLPIGIVSRGTSAENKTLSKELSDRLKICDI